MKTGRSWKLKDQRNGKMREKNQGATQSKMLVVMLRMFTKSTCC